MTINHYAINFYNKISSNLPKNNITGKQLLTITKSNQINLFVIKNIYDDWLDNFNNNKISYFDYNNIESQNGLKNFMNILSNNILIDNKSIKKLIIKAIEESIELAIKPSNFIIKDIIKHSKKIDESTLKSRKKYYSYHDNVFDKLIKYIGIIENNFIDKSIFKKLIIEQNLNEKKILIKELNDILEIDKQLLNNLKNNNHNNLEIFSKETKELNEILTEAKSCDNFNIGAEIILENLNEEYKNKLEDPKVIEVLNEIKKSY
jgi:hypothetical protein|tara:strand:+ start:2997 stop:3782 length:786 start_codon:yes stop_codon:yes gene_type:complete